MPNPNDYDSNAPSIPEEIREKLFTKPSHALGEPTKALTNALIANGNLRIEIAKLEARLALAEKVAEAAGGVADCFMVDETGDFLRGVWDRPELLKALITALAAWRAQKS